MYYLILLGILIASTVLAYLCILGGRITSKYLCNEYSQTYIGITKKHVAFLWITYTMLLFGEGFAILYFKYNNLVIS
jgi:hypothetical protein